VDIEEIREAFRFSRYEMREHAGEQVGRRHITRAEIEEAILRGEIIEEYGSHYLGPCCLVNGATASGRQIHIVLSAPPNHWIITVYEPDPNLWIDYRIRR